LPFLLGNLSGWGNTSLVIGADPAEESVRRSRRKAQVDIADAVEWLSSDRAAMITGRSIVLDGASNLRV
jgi:NAD(P)-dependent dehydrogenase (short-subunit alcohol dehydrogenase family)